MQYKRVLLKLSGEALSAGAEGLYNDAFLSDITGAIRRCVDAGVQVAVMVGAGNIWRGRQGREMDQPRADAMGMLATAINALALSQAFSHGGLDARVMTAVPMPAFAETYNRDEAVRHLEAGRVVIFGCGIGLPFFSTDTAAAMRAAEIGADVMLMAKNVDGIYTDDPKKNPAARKLDHISCREILAGGLKAIDSTAAALCMDTGMPVLVFGLDRAENIWRAVSGEAIGTIVS